jgi:hypothetical protein
VEHGIGIVSRSAAKIRCRKPSASGQGLPRWSSPRWSANKTARTCMYS